MIIEHSLSHKASNDFPNNTNNALSSTYNCKCSCKTFDTVIQPKPIKSFWAVHKVHHAIFGQFDFPCHALSHISGPPTKKVRDTSRIPPNFNRPSTKNPDKIPLYKFSLNCSRGFLSGGFVFCLKGFVRGAFCPFPLLSECMFYNRKLNIT